MANFEEMPEWLKKMILSEMLSGTMESDDSNEVEESIGFLTDSEKVEYLELDGIRKEIKRLEQMQESKKRLFWCKIEDRLQRYDSQMRLDSKTGEIFAKIGGEE